MTTLVFAALTASFVALAEDPADTCPPLDEICDDETPELEDADSETCAITTVVTLPRGCDLDLGDQRMRIAADGHLIVEHDALIQARSLYIATPASTSTASLTANCGAESCGTVELEMTEGVVVQGEIDFSAQPKGTTSSDAEAGSSLHITASSGDVVFTSDSSTTLGGYGMGGSGGTLTIIASGISLDGPIVLDGKSNTAGAGGNAGSLALTATSNIVIGVAGSDTASITAVGLTPGSITAIAEGAFTLNPGAHIESATISPVGAGGDVQISAQSININGSLYTGKRNQQSADGGRLWFTAEDTFSLAETGEIETAGGTEGAGGTIRIDADVVTLNGEIAAPGGGPEDGGIVSIAARDHIEVYGPISTGGTRVGGSITLAAINRIFVNESLNAGPGPYGLIRLNVRNGQLLLGGSHTASRDAAEDIDPSRPSGFIMDACRYTFADDTSISSANGTIELIGRTDPANSNTWSTTAVGDTISLVALSVDITAPTEATLPTVDFLNALGITDSATLSADFDLAICGAFDINDLDGDGYAWDRFDIEEGTDCNDYDASIGPGQDEGEYADGIDQNCSCTGSIGLTHAESAWIPRYGATMPAECDTDWIDEEPDDEGTVPDTGLPPSDTGVTMGPTQFDTGTPGNQYAYGDPITRCGCAQGGSTRLPWVALLGLLGVVVRRRRWQNGGPSRTGTVDDHHLYD